MDPKNESMREHLLSLLPQPANLAAYREEVASTLEKNEKKLRREKRVVIELWTFVVAVSAVFLWLGGQRFDTLMGPYFVCMACFWFLFGLVFHVGHFINRNRVDILKEVKQLQLQVLELQALLAKGDAQKSGNQ